VQLEIHACPQPIGGSNHDAARTAPNSALIFVAFEAAGQWATDRLGFAHGFVQAFCSPMCPDCGTSRGLSQEELAYEADVSRSYLSQLEKGAIQGSLKIAGKLAAMLKVEPTRPLRLPPWRHRRGVEMW
jgi:DNA-binding XRE family transcriptional regulator